MNRSGKIALVVCMSAMLGAVNCTGALAADAAFGADIENWTEEDWRSVAMADDSKVMTGVVVREAASKKSRAVGYFYLGAAAAVVNKGEEWTEIRSGSVQGFVKNRYLVFGEEAKEAALRYGTEGVTANWDEVHVFEQADADSDIMGTLGEGYKMELLADDGHWLTVKQGAENSVYVSSEDVSKVLLLDTAVPADGENAEAASAVWYGEGGMSSGEAQDSAPAEEVYDAGAAEAASSGSEEYHEDAVQASYAEQEYYDSGAESADSTYEASEGSYSVDETIAAAKVSDDAHVQYLYETYVEAQEAAMNPVSDEDAQVKADAAVEAYQNYVDAANGTDSGSSDSSDSSASSDSDVYVMGSSSEDSSSDSSSSESYSNAYGDYSDLDLLASIIYCEAGNQCYDGKVAVGAVVMNRVKSSSFPNTVAEVLNQPGQFSPASSGRLQNAIANGIPSECYSAAQDALNGVDPVPGALYFNTSSGTTKLGDHYFS